MDTARVIPRHVQRNGGFQVIELLTETVGQTGETAQLHTQSQIRAFNVTGADVFRIGTPNDIAWDQIPNLARAVPVGASVLGLWLVKTKRRPVFSLKTLLSTNGRGLRE